MTPVTERPKEAKSARKTAPAEKAATASGRAVASQKSDRKGATPDTETNVDPKSKKGDDTLVRSGSPPTQRAPKQAPSVQKTSSTQKQTVLGMQAPPVGPPPKIEIAKKETPTQSAPEGDRFTFDDMDFDSMVSSTQRAMGEEPESTFPSSAVEAAEKSPPPVSPSHREPEAADSATLKREDDSAEVPTVTLSTVPAPLVERKSGKRKRIITFVIAGIIGAAGVVAYLALSSTPADDASARSAQRPAPANASVPGPSAATVNPKPAALPSAPVPTQKNGTPPKPSTETAPPPQSAAAEPTQVEAASPVATEKVLDTPPPAAQAQDKPTEDAVQEDNASEATAPPVPVIGNGSGADGDTARIELTGVPKRAEVLVNGEPAERVFQVPRGNKAVKVEVRLSGRDTVVKRIVPGNDKTVRIRFQKR